MVQKINSDNGFITFDIQTFEYREKVAAFDYDHTLVRPNKGTFSLNVDDWVWIRPNVAEVLSNLHNVGHSIVIFTNQSKEFKVEQIKIALSSLDIPIRVYIGVDKRHQKPEKKMWELFSSQCSIDVDNVFFVGDALGRVGDWSDTDKLFADACNITIKSPEEIFPFENRKIVDFVPSQTQELVLMMGYPGSGKTTYAKTKIPESYIKLHGDELKTDAKKKKAVKTSLEQGCSVVMDATHPSKEKRQTFIEIARKMNVPVRLVHITTDFDRSKAQNEQRDKKVALIVLYVYRKKFEQPHIDEGYSCIVLV